MSTFTVYPKKGEAFKFSMSKFEFSKTGFVLYNDIKEPSEEGFIAFDKVSAIVRDDLMGCAESTNPAHQARKCFEVRLKNREEIIRISAEHVDFSEPPSLTFYVREWRTNNRIPLTGIYIALEDVVAVSPSDGLLDALTRLSH